MNPNKMVGYYSKLEAYCKDKGLIAGKSGRHMKYPYTLSAKIAQFPLFFYLKNNHIWMYYPMGITLGAYLISYIHVLANSDANQKSWAESQRKMAEKEAQHHH